jgi:hypothetical protein
MRTLSGDDVIRAIGKHTISLNDRGLIRAHVADGGFERWWQGTLLDHFVEAHGRTPQEDNRGRFGVRTEVRRKRRVPSPDSDVNILDLAIRASGQSSKYHFIELKLLCNSDSGARRKATLGSVNDIVGLLTTDDSDMASAWQCVLAYDFERSTEVERWARNVHEQVRDRGYDLAAPPQLPVNVPNGLQYPGGRMYLSVFPVRMFARPK